VPGQREKRIKNEKITDLRTRPSQRPFRRGGRIGWKKGSLLGVNRGGNMERRRKVGGGQEKVQVISRGGGVPGTEKENLVSARLKSMTETFRETKNVELSQGIMARSTMNVAKIWRLGERCYL